MPWNIIKEGKRDDVQQMVLETAQIPEAIKTGVSEMLLAYGNEKSYTLMLRGHLDDEKETGHVVLTLEVL